MEPLPTSDRTRLTRRRDRGVTEREQLHALLDEALVCHVAFQRDGLPVVVPMAYGREGDTLYLHASVGGGLAAALDACPDVCIAVTLVDGLVLARSAFRHSMNYRSAVIHGQAAVVADAALKRSALRAITDHAVPGRWAEVRQPTARELAATTVVAVPIVEASMKARTGPPADETEDLSWPTWAGVVPIGRVRGSPVPAPVSPP